MLELGVVSWELCAVPCEKLRNQIATQAVDLEDWSCVRSLGAVVEDQWVSYLGAVCS